jgi:hypothetical protein
MTGLGTGRTHNSERRGRSNLERQIINLKQQEPAAGKSGSCNLELDVRMIASAPLLLLFIPPPFVTRHEWLK